ncbi:hypothetical protein CO179_00930, partial [candidate division WWE3 bacterium CG_4_9_14_3_um_filter_39_7]
VIATDVGSTYEILSTYGYLIEPHNVEQISNAILAIINNPTRELNRAKEHKKYVQDTFDWTVISNRIFQVLNDIMGTP